MKACSKCQRLYPDDAGFCPIDGTGLKPAADVAVEPDPEDRRIGQALCGARYQIRRKVADGGMGRVYQALDLEAQANVALKVLHPEVANDAVSLERFKREYALSAELPHDHIVEVRDFQETEDGSYALVMEYLEGEELRMFLKREKVLGAAPMVRVLSQLALGLQEPHNRKFVHRDIKPDNIFLCHTESGPVAKLLDFGSVRDNTEGAKKLTVIGTTIGSPFYMSPEQAQGLPELDQRADVWSLAAIAYECLTGVVPFGGHTGPQILLAILGKEPELVSIAGKAQSVPTTLDDVMSDGLAKEPSTRIGTVTDLADRFGAAYGLVGNHCTWAYLPAAELDVAMKGARAGLEARASQAALEKEQAMEEIPGGAFADEGLVMGVPQGPPRALYIGLGVAGLLVLLGAVALILL